MTRNHGASKPVAIVFLVLWLGLSTDAAWGMARADGGELAVDWRRLLPADGERPVIMEDIENGDGMPGLRATFAVHAGRQAIWDTLVDYDNFPKFFPQITDMRVLEKNGSGATLEFWGHALLMEIHYVLKRSYVEPGRKLTWLRLSGDLKHLEGSWRIVDGPDAQTHAIVYESFVDAGFAIVAWFVRQGVKHEARRMAKTLTQWIENGTATE